jgi:formyl-CoA transferase
LGGIRVLDLSAYIAGPYGCSLLADLGAEVIKVEPPSGDTLRQYPSTLEPESRAFLGTNRSKLGIGLDLKQPQGQEALLRLVESADVLVHNFRSSVPARLGIEYEKLRAINPRLIYCALTGYGESGPLKDRAGYDQVLQSVTGICTFQGTPGHAEIVYGSIVDYLCCLAARLRGDGGAVSPGAD